MTSLLAAAFGTAGVIGAIATSDWSDLPLFDNSETLSDIRDLLAATAVSASHYITRVKDKLFAFLL